MRIYEQIIKSGSLCFDVGANIGVMTQRMLDCGAKIVIAIEPQHLLAKQLKEKFKSDQVHVLAYAISDKEGKAILKCCSSNQLATLSDKFMCCTSQWRFPDEKWTETEKVETRTLNSLIQTYGDPDFIKIDVEGYEPEVLSTLVKPVKYLCWEHTPEIIDNTTLILDRFKTTCPNFHYNFEIGDDQQFHFNTWVSGEELMEYL